MNSRRISRHRISIGLDENVCTSSATWLNLILADIMVLRDLYKKCHWQGAGEMFPDVAEMTSIPPAPQAVEQYRSS